MSNTKKCCLFSHTCGKKEDILHVCCAYCKNVDCQIRCCDETKNCNFIMSVDDCLKRVLKSKKDISIEDYKKYDKIYLKNDRPQQKKKDSTPKKDLEKKEENKSIPVKRGRGRPPKIKKEDDNN